MLRGRSAGRLKQIKTWQTIIFPWLISRSVTAVSQIPGVARDLHDDHSGGRCKAFIASLAS
jgi:hypothetical protein